MNLRICKITLIILLGIVLSHSAFAQKNKSKKQVVIEEEEEEWVDPLVLIDTIMNAYKKYGNFKGDKDSLNQEALEKFKALFMPEALVVDEICPGYFYRDFSNPYRLQLKPINDYCNKVKELYPEGLTVRILSLDTALHLLRINTVLVKMEKIIEGTTKNGLRIENHDTIELEIIYINNLKEVRINSSKLIGNMMMLNNDYDKDFIPDDRDKCLTVAAIGRENGCPPEEIKKESRRPGFFFALNFFTGQTEMELDFEDHLNQNYLQASDFSDNKNGIPKISGVSTKGAEFGFEYFLGKKRNFGFGAGFQYSQISGNIEKTGFGVSYKAKDMRNVDYKSKISVFGDNVLLEKFEATQYSIPLYLKLQGRFTQKIGFQLDAGINLILNLDGKSTPDKNIKFDYEAVYYSPDEGKTYGYKAEDDVDNSWMITKEHANAYTQGKAQSYFNDLYDEGYNVGLNQGIRPDLSTTKFSYAYSYSSGLIVKPSLTFWPSEHTVFFAGVLFMQNDYENKYQTSEYYMTKKVGEYNTMMNGIERLKSTSILINFGFKHSFNR